MTPRPLLPPRWSSPLHLGSLQRDDGLLLEVTVRFDEESPIDARSPTTAQWYAAIMDGPLGETYPELLEEDTVWSGAPGDALLTAIEGADARWPFVESAAMAFALIKRPSLYVLAEAVRARRAQRQEEVRLAIAHHAAVTAERDALLVEVARLTGELSAPAPRRSP